MVTSAKWRPIPGFDAMYSVSNDGDIRRDAPSRGFGSRACVGRIMSQKRCTNGYRGVSLYPPLGGQKHLLVHRLVALAFLGECPEGHVVNHKDGDKANNQLNNLEYVTPRENVKHAYRTGLARGRKGEENAMANLTWDTARAARALYGLGWSKSAITRALRLDTSRVYKILANEIWAEQDPLSARMVMDQ